MVITVYNVMLAVLSQGDSISFDTAFGKGTVKFIMVLLFGMLIGAVYGVATCLITRWTKNIPSTFDECRKFELIWFGQLLNRC